MTPPASQAAPVSLARPDPRDHPRHARGRRVRRAADVDVPRIMLSWSDIIAGTVCGLCVAVLFLAIARVVVG
jgi:hypothetical protein